jgi:hypothetical protein
MKIPRIIQPVRAVLKYLALALGAGAMLAGSAVAETLSATYELGPEGGGTAIGGGGSVAWIAAGVLPPGSILRQVSIAARLEESPDGTWASDLNVVVDGLLQIGSDGGTPDWSNGQDSSVGALVNDTKFAGVDFPDTIDLNAAALSLKNTWGDATWSGTVTVTYDLADPAGLIGFGLPGHPAQIVGMEVTWKLPVGTDVTALAPTFTLPAGATCNRVSGAAYDFSGPVHYVVSSADTLTVKDYTVTVVLVDASGVLHVNIDTEARTGLDGPAGGAGETWNQQLGNAGLTANGLLDSTGAATSVGFTYNASHVGWWGDPALKLLTGGAFQWDWSTPSTLEINGLTPGKKYVLHLASFHPNELGGRTLFSTANATDTPGVQIADNAGPDGNSSTWVRGVNCARFDGIVPDTANRITITVSGDSGTSEKRAYLSGFQLVEGPDTPTDPYAAWLAGFDFSAFTNPDLTPTGDPDSDGISNETEFANGLNPAIASGADLVNFGLPGYLAAINETEFTWNLPSGTDITALAPTFTLSAGATCDPISGSSHDFSAPVPYVVTSADGLVSREYTVTAVIVLTSGVVHVNIDTEARTGLDGPAGGAGEIWNQQLGNAGLTASGLLDSTGAATSVGFTCNASNVGAWGEPALGMLAGGVFQWTWNTSCQVVISGLTPGKKYAIYLASFHPNELGGRTLFSTANASATAGTQVADNLGPNGNSSVWVRGVNYVRFDEVEPDSANRITVNAVGDSGTDQKRAYISGFQLLEGSPAPADPYAEWLAGFDFSASIDPDLTPEGDPDGDGRSNQVEFAFGLDPSAAEDFSDGITRERWENIPGSRVADLTGSRNGFLLAPDSRVLVPGVNEAGSSEAYGARYRGFLTAPVSGTYYFWIAGRNESELWFADGSITKTSGGETVALTNRYGKQRIAWVEDPGPGPNETQIHEFDKFLSQRSRAVQLQAGQSYYFEVLHQQSGGADHVAVAWQVPGAASAIIPATAFNGDFTQADDSGDDDNLPDGWETAVGLDPADNGLSDSRQGQFGDFDADGLCNLDEYQLGTDPLSADTDGDGLSDKVERDIYRTNPLGADTGATYATVPAHNYASATGHWNRNDSGSLTAFERRGWISYSFVIAEGDAGAFQISLVGGAAGVPRPSEKLPLVFSLNGSRIGSATLTSLNGASDTASVISPWLVPGTYTLAILHDNYRAALQLRIDSLLVLRLAGPDADGNGSPDWLDRRLAADNRLTRVPATSLTSPACIEGITDLGVDGQGISSSVPGMALTVDGVPLAAEVSVDSSFYANVPLSEGGPVSLNASFQSGALSEVHSISWMPADLNTLETLHIRQGDSLRLVASKKTGGNGPSSTFGTYSVSLDGTLLTNDHSHTIHVPDRPFKATFDIPGVHTLLVTYQGNRPPRSVTLHVHAASFGPALSVGAFVAREWTPDSLEPLLAVEPDSRLSWDETTSEGSPRSFLVTTSEAGQRHVLARMPGDVTGAPSAIVARGTVNGFYLAYIDETGDAQLIHRYPDGTSLMRGSIVAVGLPPDVYIRLSTYFQGTLFTNGSNTLWLTAADFDQNGVANIYFEWDGEGSPYMCTFVDLFTTEPPPPAEDPPADPSPDN